MNTWITADLHLGHANIIKYCNRPYKDVEEMNASLIKNWNEKVCLEDVVIVLGDFAWEKRFDEIKKKYLEKLNGKKVFVKGNHDKTKSTSNLENLVIEYNGKKIFCTHNPTDANMAYKTNLVGHVHDLWKTKELGKTKLVNVGVDVNNFYPISIAEVLGSAVSAKTKNE